LAGKHLSLQITGGKKQSKERASLFTVRVHVMLDAFSLITYLLGGVLHALQLF